MKELVYPFDEVAFFGGTVAVTETVSDLADQAPQHAPEAQNQVRPCQNAINGNCKKMCFRAFLHLPVRSITGRVEVSGN